MKGEVTGVLQKLRVDSTSRAAIAFLAVAPLIGALLAWLLGNAQLYMPFTYGEIVSILLVWACCLWPVAWRWLQGKFEPFEPVHAIGFATLVYFGLAPALLAAQNRFVLVGIDYRNELAKTMNYAAVALLSFQVGYFSLRRLHVRLPDWLTCPNPVAMRRATVATVIAFSGMAVAWLALGRVPTRALNVFSPGVYYSTWAEELVANQGISVGYFYVAREALIAVALLLLVNHRGFGRLSGAVLLAVLAMLFFGMGWRHGILVIVLALVILYYVRQGKRPSLWLLAGGGALYLYYVAGLLGFVRSTEYKLEAGYSVSTAYDATLSSLGIAIPMAALLRYVPGMIPFRYGTTLLKVFTQPIPRALWPQKPAFIGWEPLQPYWTEGAAVPIWGEFYFNFGLLGVIASMLLWGCLAKVVYILWKRYPDSVVLQVSFALFFPLLIRSYGRGDFASIVSMLAIYLLPVLIPALLARASVGQAKPEPEPRP
ncbi:MAG TPA: O-antigen polymerase [Anaerolineae bacterium]|nr:O-antigen polymerase [Anaerolineae bacterium]